MVSTTDLFFFNTDMVIAHLVWNFFVSNLKKRRSRNSKMVSIRRGHRKMWAISL